MKFAGGLIQTPADTKRRLGLEHCAHVLEFLGLTRGDDRRSVPRWGTLTRIPSCSTARIASRRVPRLAPISFADLNLV